MATVNKDYLGSLDQIEVTNGQRDSSFGYEGKVNTTALKSAHDELGPWATAKKFKKV